MTTSPFARAGLALALALAAPLPGVAQGGVPPVVEQALARVEAGDPAAAIALLEPVAGQAGADPRVLTLLGALYVDTGRPAEALEVLSPLAAREDADPALLFHASRAAQAVGRNDRAEEYLVRSAAASPLSPAARALGMVRALQGRYGEAFRLLHPWTRVHPDDQEARLAAAQAAVRLGRVSEARELLGRLNPDAPRVRLLQADLAMLLGDAPGAFETLGPLLDQPPEGLAGEIRGLAADACLLSDQPDRAVEVLDGHTGSDPRLSLLLARAQRQLGRVEDAVATLGPVAEQLLAREAEGPTALLPAAIVLDYGRFLAAAGRHREAAAVLGKATEMNPESRGAWRGLAEALTALGRSAEAAEASRRAEALAEAQARRPPASPPAGRTAADTPEAGHLQAAFQAVAAGEPERGLGLVRLEQQRVPGDPRPRLLEVHLLLAMDRQDEALKAAEAAVQAFPDLADALYQRGAVRMARGEAESAERDFRRALDLAPDHTAALNDLAVLLMPQGRRQEARELLERLLALSPDDVVAAENLRQLEERLRQEGGSP